MRVLVLLAPNHHRPLTKAKYYTCTQTHSLRLRFALSIGSLFPLFNSVKFFRQLSYKCIIKTASKYLIVTQIRVDTNVVARFYSFVLLYIIYFAFFFLFRFDVSFLNRISTITMLFISNNSFPNLFFLRNKIIYYFKFPQFYLYTHTCNQFGKYSSTKTKRWHYNFCPQRFALFPLRLLWKN